jgi:transglutaminase-like putative cysteine protease
MNFYSVRHLTKFVYSHPVSESVMETRMHPRSDSNQRCLTFSLSVSPRCRVFSYRDHLGNQVQHFNIPGEHSRLVVIAESLVEQQPLSDVPHFLAPSAWAELDALVGDGDFSEMLLPSEFAKPTPLLQALARTLNVTRRDDPLMLVREINRTLFDYLEYVPRSTRVNSPIDEAIESREGVCQDFAHIMIACLRSRGLAARYVSGYLRTLPPPGAPSDWVGADASHAWVSLFSPPFGWIDLDPTNDVRVSTGHIVVAWGRDFGDVSPLRGVIIGGGRHTLSVRVSVQAE